MRKIHIVFLFILALIPAGASGIEISHDLPDTLQELQYWDENGVFIGNLASSEPGFGVELSIEVIPESGLVDATEVYEIRITVPEGGLPDRGGMAFNFPSEIGLSQIHDIEYADNFPYEDIDAGKAFVFGKTLAIFYKDGRLLPVGTVVSFFISDLRNPIISEEYQITGLVFNRWFLVAAGPSFSERFEIFPDIPVRLIVETSEPISLKVGETEFFTSPGFDRFDNYIAGLDVTWSISDEYDDIGSIYDGLFIAERVGIGKVMAEYESFIAESGLTTVLPGDQIWLVLSGVPNNANSGEAFDNPVIVTVYDRQWNIKTDYTGGVYFLSSDPNAELEHGVDNPYTFTLEDHGVHHFSGQLFTLYSCGNQTITATNGEVNSVSGPIDVICHDIVSFEVDASETVTAGEPFEISIINAVDENGSPANGTVSVELISVGVSPNGNEAVVQDITVINGTGSANQHLYLVEAAILGFSVQSGYSVTHDVIVTPGDLDELELDIRPTQFAGNPFIGSALISVFDIYGNMKIDFDASHTPVELTVSAGELNNPVIDGASDFVDGMADLSALDIVYNGDPGEVTISALSDGVQSNTEEIVYNGILINVLMDIPDTIMVGEEVFVDIGLTNPGNYTPVNWMREERGFINTPGCPSIVGFLPPVSPGPMLYRDFYISCLELSPYSTDSLYFEVSATYYFDGQDIPFSARQAYPIYILPGVSAMYDEGTLSVDSVLYSTTLDKIDMHLILSGVPDLMSPFVNAELFIENGTGLWHSMGSCNKPVLGGETYLEFLDVSIPELYELDDYHSLALDLKVSDNNRTFYVPRYEGFDSLFVHSPAELEYKPGTLTPTVVPAGQTQAFAFDINFTGSTTIDVDLGQSRFDLLYDGGIITTGLDYNNLTLIPGINHIVTNEMYIHDIDVKGVLTPRLRLYGMELYVNRVDTVLFGGETVMVAGGPQIKIISTDLITINPPYLNTGQEFTIAVHLENISDFSVDDLTVSVLAEGSTEPETSVTGVSVAANSSKDILLDMTAPTVTTPTLIYKSIVESSVATIRPPDDDVVAVVVQTPAEIELDYVVTGLFDGVVNFGEVFSVSAFMRNNGEANAGLGEISLITKGINFGIADSTAITTLPNNRVDFVLTAPGYKVSENLDLKVTSVPIDRNTGLPSLVTVSTAAIPVSVESGDAQVVMRGFTAPSPFVIEGSLTDLFTLELTNNGRGSLSQVGLVSMIIEISDKNNNPVLPGQVIIPDETGFFEGDQMVSTAYVILNRLVMGFPDFVLEPTETRSIVFKGKFAESIPVKELKVSIDSRDIKAKFVTGPQAGRQVPVLGEFGGDISIGANYVVTLPSFGESIIARKNPFNPDISPAEISFFLERDASMGMKIYTLTGELVYETSFPSGSNGGSAGDNLIQWYGKNGNGNTVLNGVYVLVLQNNDTGESHRFKLAVLK